MDFSTFQQYSLESAGVLFLVVCSWKLYKLRLSAISECCNGKFRAVAMMRGQSRSDLTVPEATHEHDSHTIEMTAGNQLKKSMSATI
jgi:hypothetical protein